MSKRAVVSGVSSRTSPMGVDNTTFMVEKMGAECAPLQFIRELTQNAIEGIRELGPNASGEVVWDVARHHYQLTGTYKLAIIDTGIGMTGVEMVERIKHLFCSSPSREQSRYANFGVGGKISALPHNPEGLMYFSWKGGRGYVAHLWRDPETQEYGLKKWTWRDGTVEEWGYIEDAVKPSQICDHGTMVVLLGSSEDDNTMQPPAGTPMPSRWILRYLNSRYFRFWNGVSVRAREGWERPEEDTRHNFLREVHGQAPWLEKSAIYSGTKELRTATAHWYILRADVDDDSGHVAGGGHVAALYQNELYEMVAGRAGVAKLQAFGIIFGCDRVVLYLEPKSDTDEGKVEANTARTQLIRKSEPLPWAEWAAEFREDLPDRLQELMEEIGSKTIPDNHRDAIRDRLKRLKDLFRFSRYRRSLTGKQRIDEKALGTAGKAAGKGSGSDADGSGSGGASGSSRAGKAGDVYALFLETQGGVNADEVEAPDEPDAVWVQIEDGTRSHNDMEDRAAKYLLEQNKLLINGDFRVFTDMVDRWTKKYRHVPGARNSVVKVVQEWFEQQLIEAVMSAHALRQSGEWTLEDCKELWKEEALTAAVLPRYHVDFAISRALGSRLGTLKEQGSFVAAKA